MIVPSADRDCANRMADAIGHTPFEFSVPLGGETITHYGCLTWAQDEFVAMLAAVGGGTLPDADWESHDLTAQDVADIMSRMYVDVRVGVPEHGTHFDEALTALGLQRL